jgi:hypothetical protein
MSRTPSSFLEAMLRYILLPPPSPCARVKTLDLRIGRRRRSGVVLLLGDVALGRREVGVLRVCFGLLVAAFAVSSSASSVWKLKSFGVLVRWPVAMLVVLCVR